MGVKTFIPLITPLDQENNICESSVKTLIASSQGIVTGYIPCLTSGEGWLLSDKQWQDMVVACVNHAGTCKVIAGIEKPHSSDVVRLAKLAQSVGADGVMITTPFGESVGQHEMYDHVSQVHNAIGIDLYVYNENTLSKNIIESETLINISSLPRVVGIKESMDLDLDPEVIGCLKKNGVETYQGWENRIVNDKLSDGNICSLSNLYPDLCLEAALCNSNELKSRVNRLCEEHGIYKDDWYKHIKSYFFAANVISTDLVLS